MKPLVSGPEAKRYIEPITDTYLLFPYHQGEDGVHLIDEHTMERKYPNAWRYLNTYREPLRLREARRDRNDSVTEAPFDDDGWYRFGRHQNLDKQELIKLIVAQTVPRMRVALDQHGTMYLNNVRVNGIVVADREDPWFLLGMLNSRVVDFVFRRIAKVKAGGFFEANRQFIAPLPMPPATAEQRKEVAKLARALQSLHSERRDILTKIEQRLSTMRTRRKPETWLFPLLRSKRDLVSEAPARLTDEKKREWADRRHELDLAAAHELISSRLHPEAILSATFLSGELSFSIDGVRVVERVYVGEVEGEFILSQWKILAATFNVTENTDGRRFANALRRLAISDNPAVVQQVIALEVELSVVEDRISEEELSMEAMANQLYELSEADAKLIAG